MSAPTVTVQRTVSMGHRLPSYDGDCASPHGHNLRVEVEVDAPAFVDFKAVDADLARVLAVLDHAMVLAHDDVLLPVLSGMGFRTVALSHEPTTENLACLVLNELLGLHPVRQVTVHETDKYSATATDYTNVRRM